MSTSIRNTTPDTDDDASSILEAKHVVMPDDVFDRDIVTKMNDNLDAIRILLEKNEQVPEGLIERGRIELPGRLSSEETEAIRIEQSQLLEELLTQADVTPRLPLPLGRHNQEVVAKMNELLDACYKLVMNGDKLPADYVRRAKELEARLNGTEADDIREDFQNKFASIELQNS